MFTVSILKYFLFVPHYHSAYNKPQQKATTPSDAGVGVGVKTVKNGSEPFD